LGGCPAALTQGRFTFRHNQVLKCLATEISKLFSGSSSVFLYADLPGLHASDCPQATIPVSLLVTPYRPDLVIYNRSSNCVAMMELTCPLDSVERLQSARDYKQGKQEYLMIQSELHRLGVDCSYSTVEVSVLGHYLTSSLSSLQASINFIYENSISKSHSRKILDQAASASITSSRQIFLAKDGLLSVDSLLYNIFLYLLFLAIPTHEVYSYLWLYESEYTPHL